MDQTNEICKTTSLTDDLIYEISDYVACWGTSYKAGDFESIPKDIKEILDKYKVVVV